MKRSIAALLLGLFLVFPVVAQDDEIDDLSFDEVELQDEDVPYFAVGLGAVVNFSFPDVTDLNARNKALGIPELNSPSVQWGAELFSAIGFVPNFRVGLLLRFGYCPWSVGRPVA